MSSFQPIVDSDRPAEGAFTHAEPGLWSDWLALTDDRHIVATSRDRNKQGAFAARLHQTAATVPDAQVLMLHGDAIATPSDLLHQLTLQLPGSCVSETYQIRTPESKLAIAIDSTGSTGRIFERIREVLSSRVVPRGWRGPRFRYFFWHRADALLTRDPWLFGQLVDLTIGVAAEADSGRSNHLMAQRWIYLGSPALDVYAEDDRGQMQRWLADSPGIPSDARISSDRALTRDGGDDRTSPWFIDWPERTGCLFPQVRRVQIDALLP